MRVQLFIPCFVDQLYPQTAFNMVKVLEKACCDVEYNTNQTCCGQPAFNAGFWDEAKSVAIKFEDISNAMADQKIKHALNTGATHIISTDLSCLMHLQGTISKKTLPLTTM